MSLERLTISEGVKLSSWEMAGMLINVLSTVLRVNDCEGNHCEHIDVRG